MLALAASVLLGLAEGLRLPSPGAGLPQQFPKSVRSVWIDVGTAGSSDLEPNVLRDPSVYFIGIEPTPQFAMQMRGKLQGWAASDRSAMLERACTHESGKNVTFYVHEMAACNSLKPANPDSPPVHGGMCVGNKEEEVVVQSITLQDVLSQLPPELRVQLLKVDVQGFEWPCIDGAGELLKKVDHVFLEVQDIPTGTTAMYVGQLSLGDVDARMKDKGFVRQYCEVNNGNIKELNCLYTLRGKAPIWVTGRPQGNDVSVKFDMDHAPEFKQVSYIDTFHTTKESGALAGRLRELGLLKR